MSSTQAFASEEKQLAPKADIQLVRRLFGYLFKEKRLFILAMILYPIDAISVVLPPYLVQQMLDVAIPQANERLLYVYGAIYVGALVLEYLSGFLAQQAMGVLGQRAMLRMRNELFAHVMRLSSSFFDKNPLGRTLTRLTNDIESLVDVFATGAITVVADVVTIIAVVGMMMWLDVKLTLFAFLVVPPLLLIAILFQRYARKAFREIRQAIARINTYLAEHLGGMGVVQVFRQQERTEREFSELNIEYRDANRSAVLADAGLYAVVEAIGTCAVAALIWYGAQDFAVGVAGAGTLVAFLQYIRRFFVPIRDLSTKYTVLQSGFASAERIFQLFDEPVSIESPLDAHTAKCIERGIRFEKVSFAYKDDQPVLQSLNLNIQKGEHVALVGATGSGKTTILKLLSRLYDVQHGNVSIDEVDVRLWDVDSLRRLFAVVLQDVYLFSGTVLDNLTLNGQVSTEAAKRAVEAVKADILINRLPQGYDTPVQEAGVNFSSGERQLLAFARALALDPQALILDEATSSIDSETEARIQEGLDVLMRGRTAIIVAHRLSTIRKANRIVVLEDGQVAEEGTHDELMARGGHYKALVDSQFAEVAA